MLANFDPANPSSSSSTAPSPTRRSSGSATSCTTAVGPPDGFAGPNDRWHQHNVNGGLCFGSSGVVIGGETQTPEQCQALGGKKRELTDIWMVHDWVVPGWECTWGAFAGECPELGGRTGGTAWDAPDPASAGVAASGS